MTDDAFVSLKELAERLGTDRSQFRRYVLNLGYTVHKLRTQGSGWQLTLCVSAAEANEIVARRTEQGFASSTVGVVRPTPRNLYGLKITPAKTASKSIGLRLSLKA